jgi:putative transposase
VILQRAHVYRLTPTPEQAAALAQWAGVCRYVYNLALEQRRDWWRPGRKFNYRNADSNAARNIERSVDYAHQAPKRTLRRVGKRKPSEEMMHVS